MPDKKIVILGLKGSGKSTFLAVMERALAMRQSNWKVKPIGTTIGEIAKLKQFVFSEGVYPPATDQETRFVFRVEKEAGMLGLSSGAKFDLIAGDVPGEASEGQSAADIVFQNFYQRYVKGSAAIVFLLDATELWRSKKESSGRKDTDVYYTLFNGIMAELSEIMDQTKEPIFLTFCVTKLDSKSDIKPSEDNKFYDLSEYQVEEIANSILGEGAKSIIDYYFPSEYLKWMPVSATGFTGTGNNRKSQSALDSDDRAIIINPKGLTPIGVAEALEWTLNSVANYDDDINTEKLYGKPWSSIQKGFRKLAGG